MDKVFLVASGKGGTGKTMFAVNLGALLARCGKRVALIDMDLGMRNMDLYLGMENRVVFNIADAMSGMCRLSKALLKVNGFDSLYFMAASPRKDDRQITSKHMSALCDILKKYFDYVIIDCGAGIGQPLEASIPAAQCAIVVTEPEVASLRDADTLVNFLSDHGLRNSYLVVNKIDNELITAGVIPDIQSMINSSATPIAGMIEMDRRIRISTGRGVPIVCTEGTPIEENFRQIAGRILTDQPFPAY
ncbi:MAG: septum site-determining protein MinD [Firmicutes bacterium]|nr:septum site-determining protein MinD [Bacillota bacterium]